MSIELIKEKVTAVIKKKHFVKVMCSVVAVALVGGVVTNVLLQSSYADESAVQYKEEEVIIGDIIVGVTEIGSAEMHDTEVAFDFATKVQTMHAKPGQYVSEGDLLAEIDIDDFDLIYDETALALQNAQLALQKAILDGENSKVEAEMAYNEAIYNGENAEYLYDLSLQELQTNYTSLGEQVADLADEKEELEDEIDDGLNDDYGKEDLQNEIADLDAKIAEVRDKIDAYNAHHADASITDHTTCDPTTTPECTYDIDALNEELTELSADKIKAEEDLEQAKESYDSAYDKLDDELDSVDSDLDQKSTELELQWNEMELGKLDAKSEYELNIFNYENAEEVYQNTVSDIDNTIAQAQQAVDELALEMESLSAISTNGEVFAPCDGYVMTVAEEGSELSAKTAIVTLAEKDSVNVLVSIPQEDIGDIAIDMPVQVVFDAYDEVSVDAVVDSISISPAGGMQSSVNYTVTIACDIAGFADMVVYQGMTCNATFIQKQVNDVIVVSNKCVINQDGKQYVKVLNADGSIEQIEIKTGFSDGFDVEVTEGLQVGDIAIIESAVSSNAAE